MLTRGDVHDPVIQGHVITVPEVRMTADLRLATIYVMPLGGRDVNEVVQALEHNKRFLRGEIARRGDRANDRHFCLAESDISGGSTHDKLRWLRRD